MPLTSEDYPSIPAVASATDDLDLNIPDGVNEIDDTEVHADNLVDVGVSVDYVNTVLENSIPNVKVGVLKNKAFKLSINNGLIFRFYNVGLNSTSASFKL